MWIKNLILKSIYFENHEPMRGTFTHDMYVMRYICCDKRSRQKKIHCVYTHVYFTLLAFPLPNFTLIRFVNKIKPLKRTYNNNSQQL